jgi:preprotein translocase subunit SecY
MFSWLANAWRVPELRKRILFTFFILALYRLGSWIPAPGVDSQTINDYFNGRGWHHPRLLSVFSGGALSRFALFALGIMPYVTASIILQLMTVVVPKLEQLQKEGEAGYAKINQYTRYLTGRARGRAVDRLRVPLQARGQPPRELGPHRAHRRHAHRRLHAADVDGRADHEARRRATASRC